MQLFFLNVLFFVCLFLMPMRRYLEVLQHTAPEFGTARVAQTAERLPQSLSCCDQNWILLTLHSISFIDRSIFTSFSHLDREIKLKTLKWLLADTERLYPKRIGICWTAAASSENLTYKLPLSDVLVSFSILGYWDICMCNTCLPSFSFSVLFNFKEY